MRIPRAALALLGGVVVMLVIAVVASSPRVEVLAGYDGPSRPVTLPTVDVTLPSQAPAAPVGTDDTTDLVGATLAVIVAVVVVFALIAGAVVLIRAASGRSSVVRRHGPPPAGDLVPDEEEREALARAAERHRDLIAHSPSAEAIIAAWQTVEAHAAEATTDDWHALTPTGVAEVVASTYDVPLAPLERLRDLYREVRFSAHSMTPEHRRVAVESLDALKDGLRRVRSTS